MGFRMACFTGGPRDGGHTMFIDGGALPPTVFVESACLGFSHAYALIADPTTVLVRYEYIGLIRKELVDA